MKKYYRIMINDYTSDIIHESISGYVSRCGCFGYRKECANLWVITHIKSGKRVAVFSKRANVLAFIKLAATACNWAVDKPNIDLQTYRDIYDMALQ